MSFSFDYDPGRNRILVDVRGLWTIETVRDFAKAAGGKAREVRAIRPDFDILVDSRDFPVQPQEVAALLPGVAEVGLTLTTGRAASVVGSQLNRLQAERTQTHPRIRIFMTMDDADAWLVTPTSSENQTLR